MLAADIFIYVAYMFFGIFQYAFQGQYTYNVSALEYKLNDPILQI
jgi:hypothetical protein